MKSLVLIKIKRTWLRFNAMDVKNMGITKDIVLISRRTITKEKEKNPIPPKKWRKLKRRSPRKEEVRDLYYD